MGDQTNGSNLPKGPGNPPRSRKNQYTGKRTITRETYAKLLEGFRLHPGNIAAVSRYAEVVRRTAQRAWEKGWSNQHGKEWALPIKDIIADEQEKIRAERYKEAEMKQRLIDEDKERAVKDSIKTRAEEAEAANIARGNARVVGAMISNILRSAQPLLKRLQDALKDQATIDKMSPIQVMEIFASAALVVKRGQEAIRDALEIERMRVGDPTETIKIQLEDMSLEDAQKELEGMGRTIELLKHDATEKMH